MGGALRSENVGTSNRKSGEIPGRRKPKVSLAMVINQGLVGPKAMAKAAADGQPVNIPALSIISDEGTEEITWSVLLDSRSCDTEVFSRQIRRIAFGQISRHEKTSRLGGGNFMEEPSKKIF